MPSFLKKASGVATANTSSTSTTVSGLGFQPKFVIIIGGDSTGDTTSLTISYGFSDGTNHRSVAISGQGTVATTNAKTRLSESRVYQQLTLNGSFSNSAIVAMTSDGFTLTFDSTPTSALRLSYFALGGTDLGSVAVGSGSMPTSSGNSSISGLAFTPKAVLLLAGSSLTLDTVLSNVNFSLGAGTGSSDRFSQAVTVQDGQTVTANVNAASIHGATSILQGLTASANTVEFKADLTSLNPGGFTLNFSTAPATAYKYFYLALGGAGLLTFSETDQHSAGSATDTVTGVAFQPEIGMWFDVSITSLDTVTNPCTFSVGHGTSSSNRNAWETDHGDAVTTVCNENSYDLKVIGETGGTIAADLTSLNADGFTLTWQNTNAHVTGYFLFAGAGITPVTDIQMFDLTPGTCIAFDPV